jgi:hypothetical protein
LFEAQTSLLALLVPCRTERKRLYNYMADTLATEWGTDISDLVTELEAEQAQLKALYDMASLRVGVQPFCRHIVS